MLMNLEPAIRKAREEFGRRDPEAMAINARVPFARGQFQLSFLGEEYLIHYPQGEAKYAAQEQAVPLPTLGPFTNRAIRPLLKYFDTQPEKLLAAGVKLGGKSAGIGEFSVTVPALPKIPVTFVIWPGDEEFPSSGNILFDSSAARHLPAEDHVVLYGLVLDKLRRTGGE